VSAALFEQEIVVRTAILKERWKTVVGEVPDAEMRKTTVLLRLMSTAICGTDLHFYRAGCAVSKVM
jgi:threonine dehydrogenase-like Zn-dependent dehydrogenase